MDTSQVISICQQLKSEGKEPSVALIKARMAGAKPLPLIIAGFKQWQANPTAHVSPAPQKEAPNETETIEQRVESLEAEVATLKTMLAALIKA